MTRKSSLLTVAVATLSATLCWAASPSNGGHGTCNDIPLLLIVAPQTLGHGGISGDGVSLYNNPNDPAFNGGTLYQDGVGGVYVKFQVCNGTNDFVLNLRGTSQVRYQRAPWLWNIQKNLECLLGRYHHRPVVARGSLAHPVHGIAW